LVDCDLVFPNPNSRWALPAFVVNPDTKPRMVVDLIPANRAMVKYYFPMPYLYTLGSHLVQSKVFFTLYAFKGYWQFPVCGYLDIQSFITPDGIFTPKRILQGNCNGVFAFQRGMSEIFGDLIPSRLLIWLDDVLGHAPDSEGLLSLLELVFQKCRERRLKLNASKCQFYLTEALWCGHVYSADGMKHDPKRLSALENFSIPTTASDLMQFVCAATWLSSSIADFSRLVSPLRSFLERCLHGAPVRSKKYAKRIVLSDVGWDQSHHTAFFSLIDAIRNATTLAFPNPDLIPCLFTDASLSFWSIIITQIPEEYLSRPFAEQRHQPLAFSSGEFKGASLRWSIPEKEAFPIYRAVMSFAYLLCFDKHPFHIYTDHKNLVFLFNPNSFNLHFKRHTLDRINR